MIVDVDGGIGRAACIQGEGAGVGFAIVVDGDGGGEEGEESEEGENGHFLFLGETACYIFLFFTYGVKE